MAVRAAALRWWSTRPMVLAPLGLVLSFAAAFAIAANDYALFAEEPAPDPAASANVVTLLVEPAEIVLSGGNRQQQLVVTAQSPEGMLRDVTHLAEFRVNDPLLAQTRGSAIVGLEDGIGSLTVSYSGRETRVPIKVAGCGSFPPVHFTNDIVPLFSKLGCNSGGCHGKASGQNGFKLSVFGFDTRADYDAIVKQARGRRLFPASPDESLLLAKAAARVPHGGGRRLNEDSLDYQLLRAWVAQAAPFGSDSAPRAVEIQVTPRERIMQPRWQQQLLVMALYSDGGLRDVTSAASYRSNAPDVAQAEPGGLVQTGRNSGEAAITVNYMGHVAAVALQVPRTGGPAVYPNLPVHNRVDELVWAKLRTMGILPSEISDDSTFVRRLYLDTIGTLPTAEEVRAFLSDPGADKRDRWIDSVLARDEFADFWALKWADILLVDRDKLGDRGAFELHRWLREQIATNRPYDQWVSELITASGNSGREGAVNFYRAVRTPEELARTVSQAFLGVRMECAQCHHHPFEKWSQDDFYGLAGFFNGLTYQPLAEGRELVFHAGWRETRVPLFDRPAPTKPPDGVVPADLATTDPRVCLARWLTAADNPWFARLAANRLWKHFLGRGLVEPEDDLRSTNPPTNEPLLRFLAESFVADGFDLKAMMRLILRSRVYQLSSDTNDTNLDDEQNFSHHYVRRLPAEVMLDAISQVTGSPEIFPGRPRGTRAIELWDNRWPSYFLEIFGRPARNSPCECGRSSEPTISQALHLMNAPEIESKLSDPAGRVAVLVARHAEGTITTGDLIDELCLAALARLPAEREKQVAAELFAASPLGEAAEDFLWTLLNSYDFLFIH